MEYTQTLIVESVSRRTLIFVNYQGLFKRPSNFNLIYYNFVYLIKQMGYTSVRDKYQFAIVLFTFQFK